MRIVTGNLRRVTEILLIKRLLNKTEEKYYGWYNLVSDSAHQIFVVNFKLDLKCVCIHICITKVVTEKNKTIILKYFIYSMHQWVRNDHVSTLLYNSNKNNNNNREDN